MFKLYEGGAKSVTGSVQKRVGRRIVMFKYMSIQLCCQRADIRCHPIRSTKKIRRLDIWHGKKKMNKMVGRIELPLIRYQR
jgi:hypothetical protein